MAGKQSVIDSSFFGQHLIPWTGPHSVDKSTFFLYIAIILTSPCCILKIDYFLRVIMLTFSDLKIQFVDILNFFSCLAGNNAYRYQSGWDNNLNICLKLHFCNETLGNIKSSEVK